MREESLLVHSTCQRRKAKRGLPLEDVINSRHHTTSGEFQCSLGWGRERSDVQYSKLRVSLTLDAGKVWAFTWLVNWIVIQVTHGRQFSFTIELAMVRCWTCTRCPCRCCCCRCYHRCCCRWYFVFNNLPHFTFNTCRPANWFSAQLWLLRWNTCWRNQEVVIVINERSGSFSIDKAALEQISPVTVGHVTRSTRRSLIEWTGLVLWADVINRWNASD